MRKPIILVVYNDASLKEEIESSLKEPYEPIFVSNGVEAAEIAKLIPVDIAIMPLSPPCIDGINLFEIIKNLHGEACIIAIVEKNNAQAPIEASGMGVYDYVIRPFKKETILPIVERSVERLRVTREIDSLKDELKNQFGFSDIISKNSDIKKVFELIKKVSKTSSNVLISGESGTGKELAAKAIHNLSERKDMPFVAVNCSAVPSELMESELFGYEKGAFTGANSTKLGRFEYANRGTLFLDEIGMLPMHLQAKLLRAIQERTFERVGGNNQIKVDIRVIAATNTNLDKAVREGRFRHDLYFRLRVVPIELPPLRERKEDISLLAGYFLDRYAKKFNKKIKGISRESLSLLMQHQWPGNVRELENLMERLVVLAKDGSEVKEEDLPSEIMTPHPDPLHLAYEAEDYKTACREFEKKYILNVLNKNNWNRTSAANTLKVHRNTLLYKMKELGITSSKRPA